MAGRKIIKRKKGEKRDKGLLTAKVPRKNKKRKQHNSRVSIKISKTSNLTNHKRTDSKAQYKH